MDASAWIALAGLAVVVIVQSGGMLFALGRLFEKVRSLEEQAVGHRAMSDSVIRLEGSMDHLGSKLDGFSQRFEMLAARMAEDRTPTPRRRSQGAT